MPFDDIALLLLAARLFVQLAPADAVQRAFYGNSSTNHGRQRNANSVDNDYNTIDTTWRVVDD
jgi:hypothetical protein